MPKDKNHHLAKRSAAFLEPAAPLLPADTEDSQLTQALKKYLKTKDIEQV